jgi:hypothetical protein
MLRDCVSLRIHGQNVWQASTRLSTFKELLTEYCRSASACYGFSLEVDDRALTSAFFSWTQILDNNATYLHRNAPDYFQFLVGSLLAQLLKAHAIGALPSVDHGVKDEKIDAIAKWWPSGFTLTHFCIELVRKIVVQECGQIVSSSDKIGNVKIWQSFRENLVEEPSIAIAYFDDFMSVEPNWQNPSFVGERAAMH